MVKLRKDKRGVMGIIFFFVILFAILVLGFIGSIVVGIIDFGSETVTPLMQDIGMVGDTNVTQAAQVTFGFTDTLVNSAPWLLAFAFVGALIFSIVMVLSYNYNPNPAFIGLYIALIFLLIIFSVIMSNAYEEIYNGNDEIALKLQEQPTMSYLILYSPIIFTVIAFITGIFFFAGRSSEGVGV